MDAGLLQRKTKPQAAARIHNVRKHHVFPVEEKNQERQQCTPANPQHALLDAPRANPKSDQ
eukprot:1769715-Rhodomonas_salina.1